VQGWYFVGDSHIQAFEAAATLGLIRRPSRFLSVPGATAVGLRNPESQTHAVTHFKDALLPVLPDTVPVIQLGEVDCGFVIWWRAQRHGECVERQMAESIDAHLAFIDDLLAAGYPTVVVTGTVLPTIRDGQTWGKIAGGKVARARHEVTATLRQRTDLTLRYNDRLRAEAARRTLPYVDITALTMDPATGLVADDFRSPNPGDHHLHPLRAGAVWAEAMNALDALEPA